MIDNTPAANAAKKAPPHDIPQQELRPPNADERIVRVAGLRFILPCPFKPGDVLDDNSALLINTAFHTALINRFGEQKRSVLEGPNPTYNKLDAALQAHYESFKYSPRPLDSSDPKATLSDAEKAFQSFARAKFNKVLGGQGIERDVYEATLANWIKSNRADIEDAFNQESKAVTSLTNAFAGLNDEG